MDNKRKFTGVFIPAVIFDMEELSWDEKILWCEIQALAGDSVCSASNEYFANKYHTTPQRISSKISKLKKLGLIKQVFFDGRVRHLIVNFQIGRLIKSDKADLSNLIRQTTQIGQGFNNIYNNINNNNNINSSINTSINNIYTENSENAVRQNTPNLDDNNTPIKKEKIYKLGEFKNISLTLDQIKKLITIYDFAFEDGIEMLSSYIATKGKQYKNHYAVLGKHNWVYAEVQKHPEYLGHHTVVSIADPTAERGFRRQTAWEYYNQKYGWEK